MNTRTYWLALLLPACGSSSSRPIDSDAAPLPPDTSQPAVDAPPDLRFYPLEVGRTWSYTGSQTYQGQTTDTSVTTQITGMQLFDNRNAFVSVAQFATGSLTSYVDVESADDTWIEYSGGSGQWLPETKAPVQEGASWTYYYSGTRMQTWHDVGQVTVAAGTFDDCWRIDYMVLETSQPGDVNYAILCRGVGEVRAEMALSNGFTSHTELISRSF